jgi:hypothetical protein
LIGKPGHEALKRSAELPRIELSEQPAEGVVAGNAIGQLQKAPQERFFRFREFRHVDRALATAQNSAESDHQKLMEIMQTRIAASRILQDVPATGKLFHGIPTARSFHPLW